MELKLNVGYNQVVELVRQLPPAELEKLVSLILSDLKQKKQSVKRTPLQELLLQGPTWTEQEYQNYLEARAHLNQFRTA